MPGGEQVGLRDGPYRPTRDCARNHDKVLEDIVRSVVGRGRYETDETELALGCKRANGARVVGAESE